MNNTSLILLFVVGKKLIFPPGRPKRAGDVSPPAMLPECYLPVSTLRPVPAAPF